MAPYKILVVDDSLFMRKLISDLISDDAAFEVIDTAKNGREAIEKIHQWKPDAVTLDIEMPEMSGLEALKRIMRDCPTPVIMLSSLTHEGAAETIRALELGAFDFVNKPSGSISLDLYKVKQILLTKLHSAVQTKVKRLQPVSQEKKPIAREPKAVTAEPKNDVPRPSLPKPHNGQAVNHLIALGISTGGPRALHAMFSQIPEHFPAPILIVQHMPPNFTKSLAQRLDNCSAMKVVEAEPGMMLENGTAYVAPGGYHMKLARIRAEASYRIELSKEEPVSGHRPSVEMMFRSLLPLKELKRHIVLMTGMGSDGAKGMLELKQSGAVTTIAESEESCVVYGMPRAAVELGAAMHVVPLNGMVKKLVECVKR